MSCPIATLGPDLEEDKTTSRMGWGHQGGDLGLDKQPQSLGDIPTVQNQGLEF